MKVGENTLSIRQPGEADAEATPPHGSVRRFDSGADVAQAVILSKDVRDSALLKLLDNVEPFEPITPFGEEGVKDESRPIAYDSLLLLYKTAEKLSAASSLQAFLDETTDRVMQRVGATTAVVLLRGPKDRLVPATVRHRGKLEKGEVPVSDGIVEEALRKGAALAVQAVREDERFATRESVILYGVDQVLCVPIGQKAPFAGVLYLNRPGGPSPDVEGLLDLCTAVAHLISAGVEKFQLRARVSQEERLRLSLERSLPPDAVEQRMAELAKSRLIMEQRTITVLFADIAGFTALAEKLPAERVADILNELYQRMTSVVFSFGGTVDKFLGDAMMAFFGAPKSLGDDAVQAVRAGLSLKAEWQKAMARRPPREKTELKVGLSTGQALVGTVGTESRFDYTAIGEPVNLAAWLCASGSPGQVLITGKTLVAVGARFDVTPMGERALGGDKGRAPVFEILEEDVGISTKPGLNK